MTTTVPLVVHLLYRLDFGGLETMLVERLNRMPPGKYRHAIVCLTEYTQFADKITNPAVTLFSLHKRAGLSLETHVKLWRLLRQLKPDIIHTYNLSAIEYAPVAMLAGVPIRINGTHGRNANDPHGRNRKHNLLRRLMLPFYDCCYANSADLVAWNQAVIGVPAHKSLLLANGIDTDKYQPRDRDQSGDRGGESSVFGPDKIIIGTVGRVEGIKDHASLIDAFLLLRERMPNKRADLRLAIIGDGPLLPAIRAKVSTAGIADIVWLPGARSDIAEILRGFRVFAMSSIAEGTPGSALEAMASALPVVGTRVGGIPEVIEDGVTGMVVPASNPEAMATALEAYILEPERAVRHGVAGRERVQSKYNMAAMVSGYLSLYDTLRERKNKIGKPIKSCAE